MGSFTDEEREAEARRRQRQSRSETPWPMAKCLHCGCPFPAHEATDAQNALCPVCL